MDDEWDRLPGNDDEADSLSAANGDGAADDERFSFDLAFSVILFCFENGVQSHQMHSIRNSILINSIVTNGNHQLSTRKGKFVDFVFMLYAICISRAPTN